MKRVNPRINERIATHALTHRVPIYPQKIAAQDFREYRLKIYASLIGLSASVLSYRG